jgi:hypothetical protein
MFTKQPQQLPLWMTVIMSMVFAVWQTLLNNVVIDKIS